MKNLRIKPPPLHELFFVGVILEILCFLMWPIVRDSRGPRGDPIPKRPPTEANRVRHPAGFSIVAPPDWGSHVTTNLRPFPEGLALAPLAPGPYARRSKALIVVSCTGRDRPSGLESLHAADFQGREAYERMRVVREDTFDDPPWSEYELVFRCGDDWFLARYGMAEERTTLPDMIRLYINTFQVER